ncbi:MAG: molybdopterin molybdotransferase MoeA [Planctomycetota bacterium]
MIPIEDALRIIRESILPLDYELVDFQHSVGRVLAEPVLADVDSPPHHKSVMDGFAVRASDLNVVHQFDVLETIIAGNVPSMVVVEGKCSQIMTGAPMPDGADAVVMIELAEIDETSDGQRKVSFSIDSLESGKHVMLRGTSFEKGCTIFSKGHRIRPLDIGLLAEVGASRVEVVRSLTGAVLPTGNELVEPGQSPGPGQIRNSNGSMLAAQMEALGIRCQELGIGRDVEADLKEKITLGLKNDLFVLSGGVSAGTMDLVPKILQQCGVEERFHQVKVKPGKPVWFGIHQRADGGCCYVFGLPGNPVSSLVGFRLFVTFATSLLNQSLFDPLKTVLMGQLSIRRIRTVRLLRSCHKQETKDVTNLAPQKRYSVITTSIKTGTSGSPCTLMRSSTHLITSHNIQQNKLFKRGAMELTGKSLEMMEVSEPKASVGDGIRTKYTNSATSVVKTGHPREVASFGRSDE